jgi:hypothetical protein
MPRAAPSFPAFDEWQRMSESEQDALLDSLEAGQRRGRLAMLLLTGAVGTAVIAAIGGALLALW